MRNEKDWLNHCNEVQYIQDFKHVFWKIGDAILVFVILGSNVYLFEIDYYKCLLLVNLFD